MFKVRFIFRKEIVLKMHEVYFCCLHSLPCPTARLLANVSPVFSGFVINKIGAQGIQGMCADLGWDRVNFLPSSWYWTVFWICAGNHINNTEMFKYCWTGLTQNQGGFFASDPLTNKWAVSAPEAERGYSWSSSLPIDWRAIPNHMVSAQQ